MAKRSRVKQYQGRLKRENSLLRQAIGEAQRGQAKATALILGCLVQAGGDLVFSQATTDTMNADISRMGYQIGPTPEGLVKITLVMQEPEVQEQSKAEKEPDAQIILTD